MATNKANQKGNNPKSKLNTVRNDQRTSGTRKSNRANSTKPRNNKPKDTTSKTNRAKNTTSKTNRAKGLDLRLTTLTHEQGEFPRAIDVVRYGYLSFRELDQIFDISYRTHATLRISGENIGKEKTQLLLFLNSWFDIGNEIEDIDVSSFKTMLMTSGIFNMITFCDKLSDALLGRGNRHEIMVLSRKLYHGPSFNLNWINRIIQLYDMGEYASNITVRQVLTFCRFGKRYTPVDTRPFVVDAINAFADTQQRIKGLALTERRTSYRLTKIGDPYSVAYNGYPRELLWQLREEVANFFILKDGSKFEPTFKGNIETCKLPTGNYTNQCKKPPVSKMLYIESRLGDIGIPGYSRRFVNEAPYTEETLQYEENGYTKREIVKKRIRFVKISAVPKNYKVARLIGQEMVENQFLQSEVDSILDWLLGSDKCEPQCKGNTVKSVKLPTCLTYGSTSYDYYKFKPINMHDQEINRTLCRYASLTGDLTTADLTSASDSNAATLVRAVFPGWFVNRCDAIRAEYYTCSCEKRLFDAIPKDLKKLYSFGTMGSMLVMKTQTILYTCIARLASRMAMNFDHAPASIMDKVAAYGDDIVISRQATPYLFSLLESFGFIANLDKSCYSDVVGPCYRESCGVEYYGGAQLRPAYWPRSVIDTKNYESILSLIDLQHSLFSLGFECKYLISAIYRLCPTMTECLPDHDSPCEIWANFPSTQATRQIDVDTYATELSGKYKRVLPGVPTHYERTLHNACVSQTPSTWVKDIDEANWERYLYYQYLKFGPSYPEPILELLRCSESRRSESDWTLSNHIFVRKAEWE